MFRESVFRLSDVSEVCAQLCEKNRVGNRGRPKAGTRRDPPIFELTNARTRRPGANTEYRLPEPEHYFVSDFPGGEAGSRTFDGCFRSIRRNRWVATCRSPNPSHDSACR